MPPDTLSSISRGRIIRVMQKSSGPGIAWGLSSGNPNNLHLIEFPLKNAKINEWIMWLVCLTGLHRVVWDRGVFLQLFLNVEFQHHHILKYLVVFNRTSNRQNISCCHLYLKARVRSELCCPFIFYFLPVCWSSPAILHFLYRHSTELLLNLRSDPATCYLHPSLPDPLLHNSPRGQRFCYVSSKATDSRREIHKPCVRAEEKKRSAPVLTHLLKTEWSAKFVWEGFWRCPAALSVQHMLQALASPIAFQVIGQAQRAAGF